MKYLNKNAEGWIDRLRIATPEYNYKEIDNWKKDLYMAEWWWHDHRDNKRTHKDGGKGKHDNKQILVSARRIETQKHNQPW